MMIDFGEIPVKPRNYVRLLFTHPAIPARYANRETVAKTAVAQLPMKAAKYPDDPRLMALVGEPSVQDAQFSGWWAARGVGPSPPAARANPSWAGHPRRSERRRAAAGIFRLSGHAYPYDPTVRRSGRSSVSP